MPPGRIKPPTRGETPAPPAEPPQQPGLPPLAPRGGLHSPANFRDDPGDEDQADEAVEVAADLPADASPTNTQQPIMQVFGVMLLHELLGMVAAKLAEMYSLDASDVRHTLGRLSSEYA